MEKHIHKSDMQICISQPEAAKQMNVSPRMIATVKEIERKAPEFIPRMERGAKVGRLSQGKTITRTNAAAYGIYQTR